MIADDVDPQEPEARRLAVAEALRIGPSGATIQPGLAGREERCPRNVCRVKLDSEPGAHDLIDLRIAQTPQLSCAVPELANPVILPAVAKVGRKPASQPAGNAFVAQERTGHQRKVAARAGGSPLRQTRDVQRPRVIFENIGKAVRDRQRLSRIGAKPPVVYVIGAEPIRVDEQALNNAIESADVGRQRRHTARVIRRIGHPAVPRPPVDADHPRDEARVAPPIAKTRARQVTNPQLRDSPFGLFIERDL